MTNFTNGLIFGAGFTTAAIFINVLSHAIFGVGF